MCTVTLKCKLLYQSRSVSCATGGGGGGLLVAGMCLYPSSVLTSFKINFSVIIIIMYVRIY